MSTQVHNNPAGEGTNAPTSDSRALNVDDLIAKIGKQTLAPVPVQLQARADPAPQSNPIEWSIDGIADNTRISTSFGEVPAQLLRKNDMVRTRDGALRRIDWISHLRFDEDFLTKHPEANPVCIRAGALGHNLPERDIELSPSNKMIVVINGKNALEKAQNLLKRPGVLRVPRTMLSYTQLRCEGGDTEIRSEGAWVQVTR